MYHSEKSYLMWLNIGHFGIIDNESNVDFWLCMTRDILIQRKKSNGTTIFMRGHYKLVEIYQTEEQYYKMMKMLFGEDKK